MITYHTFRHILHRRTFSLCEGLVSLKRIQFQVLLQLHQQLVKKNAQTPPKNIQEFVINVCLKCRYIICYQLCLNCQNCNKICIKDLLYERGKYLQRHNKTRGKTDVCDLTEVHGSLISYQICHPCHAVNTFSVSVER